MKTEKLILIGSSGLIGQSLLRIAKNHFSSILCVGSTSVTSWKDGKCTHLKKEDKLAWTDLDRHLDTETLVINASWGRNNNVDRNSDVQMKFANQELSLIHKVNRRIQKYVSFGSIAEVDDTFISPSYRTLYSDAKKRVFDELQKSSTPYLWIRLASIYGQNDRRDWLMNQLITHAKLESKIELKNPKQLINLCQADALAQEVIKIQKIKNNSAVNIFTEQWVTVEELSNSFQFLKEPNYSVTSSSYFSRNDPYGYLVETPPILNFILSSINREL